MLALFRVIEVYVFASSFGFQADANGNIMGCSIAQFGLGSKFEKAITKTAVMS